MEDVIIIGGGISGLRTAIALSKIGIKSTIIEKDSVLGGKVRKYSSVFPDFKSGSFIVNNLIDEVSKRKNISIVISSYVDNIFLDKSNFIVSVKNNNSIKAKSLILCCGFETFDPSILQEYGYKKYPNVITSVELENLLNPTINSELILKRPYDNQIAYRIAIVFCVGSRNVKIGNNYCSRVCCSYSIKQAIEIKQKFNNTNVVCFYMDIRTYGRHYEEMYYEAQRLGVKFIRGRVSECSMLDNGDIQIRAENTLLGKPTQGIFDIVSLSVGMMPFSDTLNFSKSTGLLLGNDGFLAIPDDYNYPYDSSIPGIFLCGTVTGLKPIKDCLIEADAVALRVAEYINLK